MFIFLICITVLTYIVNIDAENHRNQLFETYEFSIIITNLPEITSEYSVEELKVDLWDKIVSNVEHEKQQINFLKDSKNSSEIVDIQFAMGDQKALEEVKKIKNYALEIQKLDLKMNTVFRDTEAREEQKKCQESRIKSKKEYIDKIEKCRENYYKYKIGNKQDISVVDNIKNKASKTVKDIGTLDLGLEIEAKYNQVTAAMVIFRSMEG